MGETAHPEFESRTDAGQAYEATESEVRPPEVDWPPDTFVSGRYRILRRIGAGGMAEVFLAEDLFLRKQVAVKALRPSVAAKSRNVERFRKEVALAHTVTHPNVVRIHDLGEHEGTLFISMEYLEGESLQQRLTRDRKLPVDEVREIALAICHALEAAHRARVVHRDLKPSNVMLVEDRRKVVVMDFGISGLLQEAATPEDAEGFHPESSDWSVTSSGMGTLKYMSPEQVMRKPCGPYTDVYALGGILFRALSGRHMFKRGEGSYAFAHLRREAPRLRSIDPGLPKGLDEAVARCLRKDPAERFQSAAELASAIASRRLSNLAFFALRSILAALVMVALGTAVVLSAERAIVREMRPAVMRLAQLTAQPIALEELETFREDEDARRPEFQRIKEGFLAVQAQNPEVVSIYVLRKIEEPNLWEFAVDMEPDDEDKDGNGEIEGYEIGSRPGKTYDSTDIPAMVRCLESGRPDADRQFLTDEYGYSLSGYAPIGEVRGPGGYILGIDVGHQPLLAFRKAVFVSCAVAWLVLVSVFLSIERRTRRDRR